MMADGPIITIRKDDVTALMCSITDHRIKEFEVAVIKSGDKLVLSWQVQGDRIVPLHAGEPLRPTIPDPTDNRRRIPDPDEGKVFTQEVKVFAASSEEPIEVIKIPCQNLDDCGKWKIGPCTECENNEKWCNEFERRKAEAEKPKAPKPAPAPKPVKQ